MVKILHGAGNLERIVHSKALMCESQRVGSYIQDKHDYDSLVAKFVDMYKDKMTQDFSFRTGEQTYPRYLKDRNFNAGLPPYEVIAEIVNANWHIFGPEPEKTYDTLERRQDTSEQNSYIQLKESIHVPFYANTQWGMQKARQCSQAHGSDTVIECNVPPRMIRDNSDQIIRIKSIVPAEFFSRIYTDDDNVKDFARSRAIDTCQPQPAPYVPEHILL